MTPDDLALRCHKPDCTARAVWSWERDATPAEWEQARAAAKTRWESLRDNEDVDPDVFVPKTLRAAVLACHEHAPKLGEMVDLERLHGKHSSDCVPPCTCDQG